MTGAGVVHDTGSWRTRRAVEHRRGRGIAPHPHGFRPNRTGKNYAHSHSIYRQ
jgi:hypothetical protein